MRVKFRVLTVLVERAISTCGQQVKGLCVRILRFSGGLGGEANQVVRHRGGTTPHACMHIEFPDSNALKNLLTQSKTASQSKSQNQQKPNHMRSFLTPSMQHLNQRGYSTTLLKRARGPPTHFINCVNQEFNFRK